MEISGYTRLAAVVANPIKHSLSPFIQNRAFQLTATDGVYLAFEIQADDLADTIKSAKRLGMYGLNFSMPFKTAAMPYMNSLSKAAQLIGAMNTLVIENDQFVGYNTDGVGFFNALLADQNFSVAGKNMTILGGGGAAMAIIVQAILNGANEINVFTRHSRSFELVKARLERLSALTEKEIQLFELPEVSSVLTENLSAKCQLLQSKIKQSDLLVNATSVGMDGLSSPVPASIQLPPEILAVDVIYKGLSTPFLKWAESQGVRNQNGVGMLLYQAAESFKLWTGQTMPVEQIKIELEKKLAQDSLNLENQEA